MNLRERLEYEAQKYGIIVSDGPFGSIELEAPDGFCFEPETHFLVSSGDDNAPMPNILRAAIKDVENYGPMLKPCPDNCECRL